MGRILRIKNWDKHFETSETRKYVHLKWVPVTNNLSDPGYAKLMQRPDGPQLFGAWIAMLQAASRCKRRGAFVEGDGTPYDITALAAVTRMPVSLIESAIEVFTTEIKWLQWFGEASSASPEDSPGSPSLNRIESNRIESNRTELNFDHVDSSQGTEPEPSATSCADARKIASIIKPRSAADFALVAKAAVIIERGPLSSAAVWDAVEGVRTKRGKIHRRCAYFCECLRVHADKQKLDLVEMLRTVDAPVGLIEAAKQTPDTRLCVEESA